MRNRIRLRCTSKNWLGLDGLFGSGLDQLAKALVQDLLVCGGFADAGEGVADAVEEVLPFFLFADDAGDVAIGAGDAGASDVVVVVDLDPILDGAAFGGKRIEVADAPLYNCCYCCGSVKEKRSL